MQVIKSCWRRRQGRSVSPGSFTALSETGSTNTKTHMCFHLKDALTFISLYFFLFLSPPFLYRCVCLSLFFSIIPHQLPQLSFLLSLHLLPQPFLVYFTSFFPAPSPFFHSLRRSHSLIWDMLDLVSLKATLLTPCLPLLRTARAILNSFTIHQALSIGMLLNGQLFTPYWLFMLILYLALHLLDLLPFSVSRSASFVFLRCLKYLIYTYWVSLVM